MTDPQELHAAHLAIVGMANKWANRSKQLEAEGKKKEAKAAWQTAQEWLKLADRLEELTRG